MVMIRMNRKKSASLDFSRPLTHIKVQFGASGYWIENSPQKLPYGTILTELLDFDPDDYLLSLRVLEETLESGNRDSSAQAFRQLAEALLTLPVYNRLEPVDQDRLEPALLFRDAELGMLLSSDSSRLLEKYRRAREDLSLVRNRYARFLDEIYCGAPCEKKKGQKKESLAERLYKQGLSSCVGQVDLKNTEYASAPLQVSLRYEIKGSPDGLELVDVLYFDRISDFIYTELFRGIQRGFIPKRCRNCGHWFLQQPGFEFYYCSRTAPDETEKTCRDVGASAHFQNKIRTHELWQIHQRAYKKYFARMRKGTLSQNEFNLWARTAEQLRDCALKDYDTADLTERTKIAEALRTKLNQL